MSHEKSRVRDGYWEWWRQCVALVSRVVATALIITNYPDLIPKYIYATKTLSPTSG
jgi:hypothetical protein